MAKFPWSPDTDVLRRVTANHRLLRPGTLMARNYARGGSHPTTWRGFRVDGPLPGARFDHHVAGDRRGVLYASGSLQTCVAKVFQGSRVIDRFAADRCLAASVWRNRSACSISRGTGRPAPAPARQSPPVRVRGLKRGPVRSTRRTPNVEGIWYPSSMHGGHPAVVLFERAEPALASIPDVDIPLSHPGLLPDLVRTAESLGYLLR